MIQAYTEDRAAEDREISELRRRNAELQVLYETIRDLTGTLSVREVLDRLIARALGHLEAEIGSILLSGEDERLRIAVARGLPADVIDSTAVQPDEGIAGFVMSSGELLLVRDIETDSRFRRRNHERYYTSSFISAPLVRDFGDVVERSTRSAPRRIPSRTELNVQQRPRSEANGFSGRGFAPAVVTSLAFGSLRALRACGGASRGGGGGSFQLS